MPHEPHRKGYLHGEDHNHGRPRKWRFAQLGWPSGHLGYRRLDRRASAPTPGNCIAAGWSASFASAIASAAHERKIALPAGVSIEAEVNLNYGENGHFLSAQLDIAVPGLERDVCTRPSERSARDLSLLLKRHRET